MKKQTEKKSKRLTAMRNSIDAGLKITRLQRAMIKRQVDCLNAEGVAAMYEVATDRKYFVKISSN